MAIKQVYQSEMARCFARAVSLAIPAYMASAASTRQLQDLILADSCANEDSYLANIETSWTTTTELPAPQPPSSTKQRTWDEPGIQADRAAVWSCATSDIDRARLTAVSAQHSGDWLHARPISSCGLRLDDEAIRVAVGLRLCTDLCHPHSCHVVLLLMPEVYMVSLVSLPQVVCQDTRL